MKLNCLKILLIGLFYLALTSVKAFPVSNVSILSKSKVSNIQPTALVFNTPTTTSISGSFTGTNNVNGYLSVISTSATLSTLPSNGVPYQKGDVTGNSTVMTRGIVTSFTADGLSPNTAYYVFIFEFKTCTCGLLYGTNPPLTGSISTLQAPCVAPLTQPSGLVFGTPTTTSISATFTATIADEYLIVYSTSANLTSSPVNGTVYNTNSILGNATVLSRGTATAFTAAGLTANTIYYFKIFALNSTSCIGGPIYNTTSPLSGSISTISASLNFYYGNFHSHTEYSDGTGLPTGDFAYADAANCMDFLGISEHNHVAAGMSLNNWILGRAQAASASTPTFLALYGMEWGVISGGGHVIVYGVPDLLGWDAGEYQTFVAKSDYTGTSGLFSTINNYGNNAFATLAHPNNTDYSGIMTTYNAAADDAIVGTAVESGPAFSTNTTYTDPPTSMAYLSYYRNMLARGFHLGPTMDHDNHNITHGHTSNIRTVVLVPSLSENNILEAMRLMRFYASEDCSAQVTFKVNNNTMGSILTSSGVPTITVTTTTSNPVTSLKIYSGVPGSGTAAAILTSSTTGTINFTHTALTNLSTRYYYIDITESDGTRIVTSPIWYTRND
jgi:hypothetical protein